MTDGKRGRRFGGKTLKRKSAQFRKKAPPHQNRKKTFLASRLRKERNSANTCCFIVLVSHSNSFPGTWFMLLPPELTAEKSMCEMGLWAAAEQTKEAPLGLQASDRILKHSREHEMRLSSNHLKSNNQLLVLPERCCKTGPPSQAHHKGEHDPCA